MTLRSLRGSCEPESVVVFSHGFGVGKDARGLFADIAGALPVATVMFDYNEVDPGDGSLTVAPLDTQARKLGQAIAAARAQYPGLPVDLVCHSQGCVVAAILRPAGVRRAVFLAPPATLSAQRMKRQFGGRPGSRISMDGVSLLRRSDGTFTKVPATYWPSIQNRNVPQLCNDFAAITDLVVVIAAMDEVVGAGDFSRLSPDVRVIQLPARHNFDGAERPELLRVVREALA